MGKKTQKKMDLGDFLADDSIGGGSWADDDVDISAVGLNISGTTAAPIGAPSGNSAPAPKFGDRPERKEFPIPDKPPYVARLGNLPWEVNEADVKSHIETRTQMPNIVTDVRLPMDMATGKPKGFAIVTFAERSDLEEALHLNFTDFNGRKIFVNVAAPPKQADSDGLWKRGGGMGGRDAEPVEFDWGSARNSQASLPPRERKPMGDRPPRERKAEPEFDWSRGGALPPREKSERPERVERPRRQEPDLDWGVRGSALPPREKPERIDRPVRKNSGPELDWSSARGSALPPRREKKEKEMDWSRGNALPPREKKEKEEKKDVNVPRQSKFAVLEDLGDQ